MSLTDFFSNLKAKLSRKQISEKPLVPSARKKIRRSQKKLKKFESISEYDNLRYEWNLKFTDSSREFLGLVRIYRVSPVNVSGLN